MSGIRAFLPEHSACPPGYGGQTWIGPGWGEIHRPPMNGAAVLRHYHGRSSRTPSPARGAISSMTGWPPGGLGLRGSWRGAHAGGLRAKAMRVTFKVTGPLIRLDDAGEPDGTRVRKPRAVSGARRQGWHRPRVLPLASSGANTPARRLSQLSQKSHGELKHQAEWQCDNCTERVATNATCKESDSPNH
jgi:hypothetical protein